MDMMNEIAAMATDMKANALQQSVSLAVTKKVMDAQELAGQELQRMLPTVSSGHLIDTYA